MKEPQFTPVEAAYVTAKYLPASASEWIKAARNAGMSVGVENRQFYIVYGEAPAEKRTFLLSWMNLTPDAPERIRRLLMRQQASQRRNEKRHIETKIARR